MPKFSPRTPARSPRATKSAHFRRTTVANEPSPSMQAVLRPTLLRGVGITLSGACAPEIKTRLTDLGAHDGADVLVHAAERAPQNGDDVRAALDDAWDAIRAHK